MASSKEYLNYILEQLSGLEDITEEKSSAAFMMTDYL